MRLNLSLRQLEVIVEVAETGSFRAAARQLGISQPALSRTLRLAEQALGARLFDRDTRRVTITPAGQELLHIARRVLGDFDSALSELGHFMQGYSGQVSVAALPSMNVALLPSAIAQFRQQHPQVEFKLQELAADALLAAVEEGRADFGLCAKPAPDQRLRYQLLREDPMVLVCRDDDPLAQRTSVPWSILAERPCLAVQAGSSIRQIVDGVFVRKRLVVRASIEAPSVAACCALVKEGLGIAALPRLALGLADARGLALVPLVQPAVSRSVGIVTRIGRTLAPASLAFIKVLTA
ncbi:MAG: LysR family transcriptional regulator [Proteobacteria bacterium]|nr:LysR family transcriptional regulator [Pseudomonadota bacterium]